MCDLQDIGSCVKTTCERFEPRPEEDPTGRSNKDCGAKLDEGKLRYTLIPPSSLKWLARLWTNGAEKYSPNGWKEVPEGKERYTDALFRHLEAYRAGEWTDKDTKVPHLIAVAWNALVVVWLKEH